MTSLHSLHKRSTDDFENWYVYVFFCGESFCANFFVAAPPQVAVQHINFCTVLSIAKLLTGSPTCLYRQHFAMFTFNCHYNVRNGVACEYYNFSIKLSTCRVAGQVDRSECAVGNCWEQWTREGTHARKTGTGVTRKTTRREDRRIVRQALVDPTVSRSTIRADVGVAIVPQIISRHLAKANLKSKRPFRALPLTPEHRQLRLQWCQARSMWNVTDWQKVVLSDESRIVLGTDDNRVRVWRCPEPFLNGLPGEIFHQDNARPHTARVAQDFLRRFQTHPWSACSPDLSPVEHVWDQLKRQMSSCPSVHDLVLAVQDLWAHLPQDNIRCLINSMPDRGVACIADGGGPTRY
ncbi:transposable element Tc1 transposase [Trichonephila clavipes]|nr:transposable element Tc1 transposase [Trichonephila clavipes]